MDCNGLIRTGQKHAFQHVPLFQKVQDILHFLHILEFRLLNQLGCTAGIDFLLRGQYPLQGFEHIHIGAEILFYIFLEGKDLFLIHAVNVTAVEEMVHPVCQQLHFIKGTSLWDFHHCIGHIPPVCNDQQNGSFSIQGKESDIVEFLLDSR